MRAPHLARTLLPILPLLLPCRGAAEPFAIRSGKDGSLVQFRSKAAMETFDGRTRSVEGMVDLDPSGLGARLSISVTVDMASLDTGIALRDRHMRENHLHTERFPVATFEGAEIVEGGGRALVAGERVRVTLAGTLTIHGVAREVQLPVDLAWDGGDRLEVASRFPVALAEHEIPRPQFLLLRLGDVQQVEVALVAVRAPSPAPREPDGS
jgi:polyisoprenoid-binding protein YceI